MSVVTSLWASVQGDPVFMRRVNGWFTIFWVAMIPVSITFGLLSSVSYVATLSLWALVSGHWSGWQAARVEVEQQFEAAELAQNPVEQRVVAHLVEETQIERIASPPGTATLTTTSGDQGWTDLLRRLDLIESALRPRTPEV